MIPMKDKINRAFDKIDEVIRTTNNQNDLTYFKTHRERFTRMIGVIGEHVNPSEPILEIGSHYLHTAMILSELGYKVYAVDVDQFWDLDFVHKRLGEFNITSIRENNLENFDSIDHIDDSSFRAVLFAEILEHITFNPIAFWERVYNKLQDGGFIYISTPNSFALPSLLRSIKNIITFKGIGTNIHEIFSKVTYGHHWKEYSKHELKIYFRQLSDGFNPRITTYYYNKPAKKGLNGKILSMLSKIGNLFPPFREDLEAVVWLKKEAKWKAKSPEY